MIDCENSGRGFYFHSGETAESVVSGFTIKNGNVMNTGGGIHCENASPVISNCVITDCQITLNYTSGNDFGGGAGIYAKDSNIAVTDSSIIRCTVNGQWSNCGGGGLYFYTENSSVTTFPSVVNCLISNNKAELAIGGGIYSGKCSLAIRKCNITDNSAWYRGGIHISGSGYTSGSGLTDAVITDTNLLRNTAKMAGGIEVGYYARLTMERCNIRENIANRDGGGGILCSIGTSTTLRNCIVSKNMAVSGGGGMECYPGATLNIINSTIADNNGTPQGGAIYCPTTSPPSSNCIPNIINSIIWGNIPDQISLWDPNTGPAVSYSDIQDSGYAGAGNISANPLFAGNGDYHLTAASPCINTGTSGSGIPDTDIEGKAKPQGSGYDMGAYEW